MQRVADEKEYFGVRWLDSAFIRYGSTYLRFGLIRCGMSKKAASSRRSPNWCSLNFAFFWLIGSGLG